MKLIVNRQPYKPEHSQLVFTFQWTARVTVSTEHRAAYEEFIALFYYSMQRHILGDKFTKTLQLPPFTAGIDIGGICAFFTFGL